MNLPLLDLQTHYAGIKDEVTLAAGKAWIMLAVTPPRETEDISRFFLQAGMG